MKLIQQCSEEEVKYLIRWLEGNLRTGVAELTVIASLARAICYTPPHLINTEMQVLNQKKEMRHEAFNELCAATELAIKEASCEYPDYGAVIE